MAKTLTIADFLGSTEMWAAFIGALAAFGFEWIRSWVAGGREKQDAVNRALIALSQMHREMHSLWEQIYVASDQRTQQLHGRQAGALEVSPTTLSEREISVDLASLVFLLRTHDPDILNRLTVVESKYDHIRLDERARISRQLEAQEKFSAAGHVAGEAMTMEQVKARLGTALWSQLNSVTTAQRDHIPRTIDAILAISRELGEVAGLYLPCRGVIQIQPGRGLAEVRSPYWWRRVSRASCQLLHKVARKGIA